MLNKARKVVVTGATGFIGGALLGRLGADPRFSIVAVARRSGVQVLPGVNVRIANMAADTDWNPILMNVDVVIHTAARVHVMDDKSTDPLAEFRKVNVEGTLNLARQAAAVGAKRFIYISSIKVNGERTRNGFPYTAEDAPAPVDPYGVSKMEAEQALQGLKTGMEITIIRPVLVYGPGVKANFRSMMDWLSKGIPLPLGAVDNKRSLVSLDNLTDLITRCIDHPAAANQIFLVSDGEDLSTTELLRRMGRALNKPARLLPVPAFLLEMAAGLLGKRAVAQRLFGSLQVDISKTRRLLGWIPPVPVNDALAGTAQHFISEQEKK